VLQYAYDNGCAFGLDTCELAATGGHLNVLRWLRAHNCAWGMTCAAAAKGGHLHILKWARANGCPWDNYTCAFARRYGHTHVLNWARNHECTDFIWPHVATPITQTP
jgi:hypothetical protein